MCEIAIDGYYQEPACFQLFQELPAKNTTFWWQQHRRQWHGAWKCVVELSKAQTTDAQETIWTEHDSSEQETSVNWVLRWGRWSYSIGFMYFYDMVSLYTYSFCICHGTCMYACICVRIYLLIQNYHKSLWDKVRGSAMKGPKSSIGAVDSLPSHVYFPQHLYFKY